MLLEARQKKSDLHHTEEAKNTNQSTFTATTLLLAVPKLIPTRRRLNTDAARQQPLEPLLDAGGGSAV